MAVHISARVAWHRDGWNGHICKDPAANTYCVGCHSYPGEMIRERRNLDWEQANAGRGCSELESVPPCVYSLNAFGTKPLKAFSDPPEFFSGEAERREWIVPPATVCVWPYEEMYGDEVKTPDGGKFDYDKRLERAKAYFDKIEPNNSLIFYYANYSNPFSEDEQPRYVIVGLSRVKKLGDIEYYENCTPQVKKDFAGGFVWQRNVTSHYPDEGLRLPYHRYHDQPDVLEKILLVPDNPRNFKYGTRAFSDDEALNLVERFLEVCGTLRDMGDTSENWPIRIEWLQSLIAELWKSRGLYPGMANMLRYLQFNEATPYWKERVLGGQEQQAREALFSFLNNGMPIAGLPVSEERAKQVRRQWRLKEEAERKILAERLPRFDLTVDQLKLI